MIELYTKVGNRALRHLDDPYFKFPGGEWDMKVEPDTFTSTEIAYVSGSDVEDYIKLALWADTVRKQDGVPHAIIPYLPAARADRGTPCGADIYAALIESARVQSITVFDPHSPYMVDLLEEKLTVHILDPADLITESLLARKYTAVISPDEGARDRADAVASKLGIPVIYASKTRNFKTGALSGFECPSLPDDFGNYLVIDDICDGGGTFIGLAAVLRERVGNINLDLYVSHGIFSKGIVPLMRAFNMVYTTNSLASAETSWNKLRILDLKTQLLASI